MYLYVCIYVHIYELTIYNSSVPIQDVAWKTSWERWTIKTGGESLMEIRTSNAT